MNGILGKLKNVDNLRLLDERGRKPILTPSRLTVLAVRHNSERMGWDAFVAAHVARNAEDQAIQLAQITLQVPGYDGVLIVSPSGHDDIEDYIEEVSRGDRIRIYHRTSPEAATAILSTGRFISLENTGGIYVSDQRDGQAIGYGTTVVELEADSDDLHLDDEWSDENGPVERHYWALPDALTIIHEDREN